MISPANTLESAIAGIPGLRVKPNEPLAPHTSMGVGGPARWFIEVDERAALAPLIDAIKSTDTYWMMLGGGSNTLFSDEGFEGAVLHLGREFKTIEPGPEPDQVRAGAAAIMSAIMNFAKRRGLSGLEFCAGIPGVLGGALAGNAGAGGLDICTLTESVDVLTHEGAFLTRRRGEFEFAYRKCDLRNDVILGANLHLCPDTAAAIDARIEKHLSKRWEQPVGSRSSGCMFKNPAGDAAGRLIDQTGLKGLRVGGIAVSDRHANFMVNDGEAKTTEILALMESVREKVHSATGVDLESEVRVIPPRRPDRQA